MFALRPFKLLLLECIEDALFGYLAPQDCPSPKGAIVQPHSPTDALLIFGYEGDIPKISRKMFWLGICV